MLDTLGEREREGEEDMRWRYRSIGRNRHLSLWHWRSARLRSVAGFLTHAFFCIESCRAESARWITGGKGVTNKRNLEKLG